MYFKLETSSSDETLSVAEKLTAILKPQDIVILTGDLGAGKTCFVKGVSLALGIKDNITSPTFTILKSYTGRLSLYHFDLYRIDSIEEMFEIGLPEYLPADGVTMIEWGDKARPLLRQEHLDIDFRRCSKQTRREIIFQPNGEKWMIRIADWFMRSFGTDQGLGEDRKP